MLDIHKKLSTIIRKQFPAYYNEYGPYFIEFVYDYYKWLDEEGQLNNVARSLDQYQDIDYVPNEFLVHFKNKYLDGIKFQNEDGIRRLIKYSRNLYDSKGSERSIKLLFELIYNDDAYVTRPDEHVLKPSNGIWKKPYYLEIQPSETAKTFVGRQVTGSISGSTAFVETHIRRFVNGKYFDVLYLSNPLGSFTRGDQIVIKDEFIAAPPKLEGSLSYIIVQDGGANNAVGDLYNVSSAFGSGGVARVANIESSTGKVTFNLIDGGRGYTMNASVSISEHVLYADNISEANLTSNTFLQFETLKQDLANITFISGTANQFSNGLVVTGYVSANSFVTANGIVVTANQTGANGTLRIQVSNGDFSLADTIRNGSNTINGVIDTYGDISATANLIGFTSNSIGVISVNNSFRALNTGATWVHGLTTNATANILGISTGSGASFDVGSLSETENVSTWTDLLSGTNAANVPYLNINCDGSNSGIGFVTDIVVGSNVAYTNLTTNAFSSSETVFAATISNAAATFAGTVATDWNRVDGTGTNFTLRLAQGEFMHIANATAFDLIPVTTIANSTTVFLNRVPRVTGSGLTYGKAILTGKGTNYAANATNLKLYKSLGAFTTGNVVIGNTSTAIGTIGTVSLLGGTGYSNSDVANVSGGNNSVNATANLTTNATGGITSFTLTNLGNGFWNTGTLGITTSGGSGVNAAPIMDYGFGLPKDVNADGGTIIRNALNFGTYTIGTIASISNINLGDDYNYSPYVVVIEPIIAAFGRHDILVDIGSPTGSFLVGETVTQNIATNTYTLSISIQPIEGTEYTVGEGVYQGPNTTLPIATGIVIAANTTKLTVGNVAGTFINTSNSTTYVVGLESNTWANVTASAANTVYSVARGVVLEANSSQLLLDRVTFNTSVLVGQEIAGTSTGVTANVIAINEDLTSTVMGFNANVTANVVTANGIVTKFDIVDSGFGFIEGEEVELTSDSNDFQVTGIANTQHMGIGAGSFISTRGFLNEAVIHDNDKWQAYSYVINSSLSIDKYEDILKKLLHVAGTKMFGNVNKNSNEIIDVEIVQSEIEIA